MGQIFSRASLKKDLLLREKRDIAQEFDFWNKEMKQRFANSRKARLQDLCGRIDETPYYLVEEPKLLRNQLRIEAKLRGGDLEFIRPYEYYEVLQELFRSWKSELQEIASVGDLVLDIVDVAADISRFRSLMKTSLLSLLINRGDQAVDHLYDNLFMRILSSLGDKQDLSSIINFRIPYEKANKWPQCFFIAFIHYLKEMTLSFFHLYSLLQSSEQVQNDAKLDLPSL